MDPILIHLRVTHLPIIAVPIAAVLLLLALWRPAIRELWIAALIVSCMALAGALAALASGEEAEELAEQRLPAASERYIEPHEERAEKAAIATGVLAAMAAGCALLSFWRPVPRALGGAALASAVVAAGLLAWTGEAGGKIAHPEIRSSAGVAGVDSGEHDDD